MQIVSELSEPITLYEFGKFYKLIIQFKLSRGIKMIDLRMWKYWSTDKQFHPSKNGLMIEMDKFKTVLLKINELMSASD